MVSSMVQSGVGGRGGGQVAHGQWDDGASARPHTRQTTADIQTGGFRGTPLPPFSSSRPLHTSRPGDRGPPPPPPPHPPQAPHDGGPRSRKAAPKTHSLRSVAAWAVGRQHYSKRAQLSTGLTHFTCV
jgi:hypothetical protein